MNTNRFIVVLALAAGMSDPVPAQLTLPWNSASNQAPAATTLPAATPPPPSAPATVGEDRGICLVVPQESEPRLRGRLSGSDEIFEVSWQALPGKSEAGTFYQVAVSDAAGHIVWRSPETRDVLHPLAFGSWDIGESFPTALADVDGDGALELIAPAARSDVSPVRSRPQPLPRKTAPVGHEWDTAHV